VLVVTTRRAFLAALAALLPAAMPWPKCRGLWLSPPWDNGVEPIAYLIGAPPDLARFAARVPADQLREWRAPRYVLYGAQLERAAEAGARRCRDWYAPDAR
jgi:hypothetical protein